MNASFNMMYTVGYNCGSLSFATLS